MIETEYNKIEVKDSKDKVCLRIEDTDAVFGYLNLCWLDEDQLHKLIRLLQESERRLVEYRVKMSMIFAHTDFAKLYNEFEKRYNKYPVQMSCSEAFGKALGEGLIDEDTYEAAYKYYGKLWNYVGD